jgi:hypothetical protein
MPAEHAALPPHSAVRLSLTVRLFGIEAMPLAHEAEPQRSNEGAPERQSLSALCCGKAAWHATDEFIAKKLTKR